MDFTFTNIFDLISGSVFDGSTTITALALIILGWAVCAVICLNLKAPPTYSVVPMIPMAIFFNAYGLMNETVMFIIIIVASLTVAVGFRKAVD